MSIIFPDMESLKLIILALMLAPAAVIDLKFQRIPNKITFPAAIIGLVINIQLNGFDGFLISLQGLGLGVGFFIIPYIIGMVGAGDAKLMGAIGAFIGPKGVIVALIYIAIAGGIYSLFLILLYRRQFKGFFQEQYATVMELCTARKLEPGKRQEQGRPRLSYGVAIAIGTWLYIGLALFGAKQLVSL